LHRLEKIFQREAVDIKRDRMSRWLIAISEKLTPLKALLHKDLLANGFMAMDETTIQVLKEKDRRPDQKSFMLVQACEGPPGKNITLFHYEKSRSAETVGSYLHGFNGSLITDGLGVYMSYCSTRPSISHGGCMSHARRKFTDAVKGKKGNSSIAKTAIVLMAELFKIEADIKGKALEERLAIRQEKSKPFTEKLGNLWLTNIDSIPAKSLTGKALHYLKNQWPLLCRFLVDPKLPMHNNYLERQIRPLAVGRRAWLFADTMAGAHASSVFYSLLNTAKENGLNPLTYLSDVLVKIDAASDLRTLLPYA
jgi:transposase